RALEHIERHTLLVQRVQLFPDPDGSTPIVLPAPALVEGSPEEVLRERNARMWVRDRYDTGRPVEPRRPREDVQLNPICRPSSAPPRQSTCIPLGCSGGQIR